MVHPAEHLSGKVEELARIVDASSQVRPFLATPLLTTRFTTAFGELSFFSMFTTFGTPWDITLASLRVEHLFAADDETRTVVARHAVGG